MEMWSFAAQVNEGGVMSAAAVVLALVLNIVSDSLDLVKHGLGICQSLRSRKIYLRTRLKALLYLRLCVFFEKL
jgi:hypothetical protein